MNRHPEFSTTEQEWLGRIMRDSLEVRTREQFFAWTQGPVQTLVPHDILICGFQDQGSDFRVERFTVCRYFRTEHLQATVHPNGLLAEVLKKWLTDGHPVLMGREFVSGPNKDFDCDERLLRLELRNLVTHAIRWHDGSLKSHISFARVMCPFDERLVRSVQVLSPVVAMTLARVMASEGCAIGTDIGTLSPREIEILESVRDGRTNPEIAVRLGISPLTVKNHIRHILKKLQVRTRGHAVVKALSTGLLNHHTGGRYAGRHDAEEFAPAE